MLWLYHLVYTYYGRPSWRGQLIGRILLSYFTDFLLTYLLLTTAYLHREAAEEGIARLDADLVSIVLP